MKWALSGAALLPLAWGCSYVELPYPGANGSSYLIGRTMEMSNVLGGLSYDIETVPTKASGGKYGYLGMMSIFHLPALPEMKGPSDGMNEVGLTVSALELDQSIYQQPEAHGNNIEVEDVVGGILAHCSTVDEALSYLASARVVVGKLTKLLGIGLHWAIADAAGRSVVVEILEGKQVVYENTPRVMTNDPDLQWQWRNLNTYTNLNPHFPTSNNFLEVDVGHGVGKVPHTVGHGWNLAGLPGDSSPPSRFARLFYLRGYALHTQQLKDYSDAVVLGTGLLNNVYIPYGVTPPNPAKGPGVDRPEFTPFAMLKSATDKAVLFRGYRNSQWRLIDLKKINFEEKQTWVIEDGSLGIEDVTSKPVRRQAVEQTVV